MKKTATLLFISLFLHFFSFAQTQIGFDNILSQINADSIQKTIQDMQDFSNRTCIRMPDGNKDVANYIVQRLHNYGIANAAIDSFYYQGYHWLGYIDRYFYNVKGHIAGSLGNDTVYIIGAHLDAIANISSLLLSAPGADDNASGCAVMIEMARIFHKYNIIPRYQIDFMAWDAEELGLLGSKYDAGKRFDNQENIIVLNNDMVATQSEETLYRLNFHWYDNSIPLRDIATEICQRYTSILPYIPIGAENNLRTASDSWAYNQFGYQALFYIEHDFSTVYHTVNDLLSYCNTNYTKEVAKLNFAVLYHFNVADVFNLDTSFYIITATASSCGTITPSGDISVRAGENIEFTFSAEEGCLGPNNLSVDGISITISEDYKYTFIDVSTNHTIHVDFIIIDGEENYNMENMISLYPNPATHQVKLVIENNNLKATDVAVYDIYGKLLQMVPVISDITSIDISACSSGIYLFRLNTETGYYTKKVVKK